MHCDGVVRNICDLNVVCFFYFMHLNGIQIFKCCFFTVMRMEILIEKHKFGFFFLQKFKNYQKTCLGNFREIQKKKKK